jgi:Arc/MetJ-type ribon-helix-helix transcriptional regulator
MKRKTISLPDELAEYVDDSNLNLSRFVQDKLRELSGSETASSVSEKEAKEIASKLEELGYLK